MLRRGRSDVVKNSLIDSEVHEVDSELRLNLGLFLDGVFNDNAHLFNGIHFSLLSDIDPVLKHLVKIEGSLACLT